MKKPVNLKTAFATYAVEKTIGQGGNGYVYEISESGKKSAAKVLDKSRATREKLKRFENEFRFCSIDRHQSIIQVQEYGLTDDGAPFFTMPLYKGLIFPPYPGHPAKRVNSHTEVDHESKDNQRYQEAEDLYSRVQRTGFGAG